mmetsp:Transcript_6297/g.19010  ORF Transcript_6297/g.19010 Transcript_6297/m.19010 type:complete len:980 (+) Transcript_6297:239-3178(+)
MLERGPATRKTRAEDKSDVIVGKLGKYKILGKLGKGGRGVVYKALLITEGIHVAIKRVLRVQLTPEEEHALQEEIELLKNLEDDSVVNYFEAIDNSKSSSLDIVMEYVEGGSLEDFVSTVAKVERDSKKDTETSNSLLLEERLVAKFVKQILHGLRYLHQQGVIHRDIKGANILMTKDRHVKLSDFGVSVRKHLDQEAGDMNVVGTPYWMAPEIISLTGVSTESDIWSLGCTIVELLTGNPPYGDLNEFSAMYRIVTDDRPPLPSDISGSLEDFLLKCFTKDMAARSKADELLRHKWILENADDLQLTSGISNSRATVDGQLDSHAFEDGDLDEWEENPPEVSFTLDQYEEHEDDVDEWEELDGDDAQAQPEALSSAWSDGEDGIFSSDIEDDPVAEIEKEREKRQREQWDRMSKMAQRLLDENVNVRMSACRNLREVFTSQPEQKSNFLIQPGLLPLLDNLENPQCESLLEAMLSLLDCLIADHQGEDPIDYLRSKSLNRAKSAQYAALSMPNAGSIAEHLCMSGFIPVIIPLCAPCHSVPVRLSAARFLRRMTKHKATMQMLCSCRVSTGFISLLETILSTASAFEMAGIAIEGLRAVLMQADRSFFTRQMCHEGVLQKLVACMDWISKQPDSTEYADLRLEAASLVRIFAERSDTLIKRKLAEKEVLEPLIRALDAPKEEHFEPTMEVLLASILDLSRDPYSHSPLQQAGIIPRLVGILDHYHSSYATHTCSHLVPKMMSQVISTLSNLCRVSSKRQELACTAGLIPHLQWFVTYSPLMKAWSLDLYAGLPAVSKRTREELWKHDGLDLYVNLLFNPGTLPMYVAKILQSILEWLEDEKGRVEAVLLAGFEARRNGAGGGELITLLISKVKRTARGDAALESTLKMMQISGPLAEKLLSVVVLKEIVEFLPDGPARLQIILLRMLQTAYSLNILTPKIAAQIEAKSALDRLMASDDAVTVKEQAAFLLRELQPASA